MQAQELIEKIHSGQIEYPEFIEAALAAAAEVESDEHKTLYIFADGSELIDTPEGDYWAN